MHSAWTQTLLFMSNVRLLHTYSSCHCSSLFQYAAGCSSPSSCRHLNWIYVHNSICMHYSNFAYITRVCHHLLRASCSSCPKVLRAFYIYSFKSFGTTSNNESIAKNQNMCLSSKFINDKHTSRTILQPSPCCLTTFASTMKSLHIILAPPINIPVCFLC